jgi:hypothetical protein
MRVTFSIGRRRAFNCIYGVDDPQRAQRRMPPPCWATTRAHEYLTEAETEVERLRELVPDTEPLGELLRR